MGSVGSDFPYPRRRAVRSALRVLCRAAFAILTDLHISGLENLPQNGPLILVGNHFSYIDPVATVRFAPWQVEFLGGFHNPYAPFWTRIIPWAWGFYPVYRGTASLDALRAAEAVLAQRGVVVVFPEGGNWATVLRPARPGAAFLAARTGVPILPVGYDGLTEVFTALRRGKRAHVTLRIGAPIGPFRATGRGRERREQLEEIGHEIMRHIAALIPPQRRGHYSDDPDIRAAAQGTEIYPWADAPDFL